MNEGEDLAAFLKRLAAVFAAGASLASTPMLLQLVNLQPPISLGVILSSLASVVIFIGATIAFCWGHKLPKGRCQLVGTILLVLAGLSGIVYVVLFNMLTIDIGGGELRVRGFRCQEWAALEYTSCPRLSGEQLADDQYNPAAFYTPGSLALAQYLLLTTWLVLIAGLASGIAWVVAGLRQGTERSPTPAGEPAAPGP